MILGFDFVKPTANGSQFIKRNPPPKDNILVNLIWWSNKFEASQPKQGRLHQQLKPTRRKTDPLKLRDVANDMIAMRHHIREKDYAPEM